MSGLPDFSKPPPHFYPSNSVSTGKRFPPPNFNPHFLPPLPMQNDHMLRHISISNRPWNNSGSFPNFTANRFTQPQAFSTSVFHHGRGTINEGFPHCVRTPQFSGHNNPGRGNGNSRFSNHQRGGGHNGFTKTQKKVKIDKRLLPENNVFFCDICDRGFKNEELYKQHTEGHIKCTYKDCPFFAAPKLVQLHMSMQHRTGLAKKVWSLESDDDVKKWREERKKNFPTVENQERKKKEDEEKLARGERIQMKDFSKFGKDRHRGRGRRGGRDNRRGRWSRGRGRGHQMDDEHNSDSDEAPPEEMKIVKETLHHDQQSSLKSNDGEENNSGLGLLAYYGDSTSDSEDSHENDNKPEEKVAELPVVPLSKPRENLLPNPFAPAPALVQPATPSFEEEPNIELQHSHYSNEDSIEKTESVFNYQTPHHQNKRNSPKKAESSSNQILPPKASKDNVVCTKNPMDQKPNLKTTEEKEASSKSPPGYQAETKNRKSESQKRYLENAKRDNQTFKRKRLNHDYTLLEKLLAPDIRRERNKILQCVHYIIQHKFFDQIPNELQFT